MVLERFDFLPTLTPGSPLWLWQAIRHWRELGRGSFSVVLETERPEFVVKLSLDETGAMGLHRLSQACPLHYPLVPAAQVLQLAPDQKIHALLVERAKCSRGSPDLRGLETLFERTNGFVSAEVLTRALAHVQKAAVPLPASLAAALACLSDEVRQVSTPVVMDLHRPDNWGRREDGTWLLLDPFNAA